MRRRNASIRLLASVAVATFCATTLAAVPGATAEPAAMRSCTITGTNGPDLLRGTPGDDVICGLLGNDVLIGLGGDDVLIGGRGRDSLLGGSGDDELIGGPGRDVEVPDKAPGDNVGFYMGVKFTVQQREALILTPVGGGLTECTRDNTGGKLDLAPGAGPYLALFYAYVGIFEGCLNTSASAAYDVFQDSERIGTVWWVATQPGVGIFGVKCQGAHLGCNWFQAQGATQGRLELWRSS